MARKRRDPTTERWWVELEHVTFGTVKVACTWARLGPGIYAIVPLAIESDLFTPQAIADQMAIDLKSVKARILLNEHSDEEVSLAPW